MPDRPVIDAALVEHIAALAQIELDPTEKEALARDLEQIVDYVRALTAVDVSAVAPCAHALETAELWRADEVVPGLGVELSLRAAPEALAQGFGVPKVIE